MDPVHPLKELVARLAHDPSLRRRDGTASVALALLRWSIWSVRLVVAGGVEVLYPPPLGVLVDVADDLAGLGARLELHLEAAVVAVGGVSGLDGPDDGSTGLYHGGHVY